MIKIVFILGARPQFIKAAPLFHENNKKQEFLFKIIHTGQHFDENMSNIFFHEMEIPNPDYHLGIHSLKHGAMTGRMLEKIEDILIQENPQWVMVFGDTNSTLAGALAASKLNIPVAHGEAGLRSFNPEMPEETNRILTDRISSILFCPSKTAINNLLDEGYQKRDCQIINSGDIMFDSVLLFKKQAEKFLFRIENHIQNKYILATIHRQENTNNPERLKSIIKGLNRIAKEIKMIVPLHPRTKKILKEYNIQPEFQFIKPVGYFDMINLINNSELVITDSGGLQKEAYYLNKKTIVLREETEWVELIENECSILSGWNWRNIYQAFKKTIVNNHKMKPFIYGDGNTSSIIIKSFQ